MADFLKAYRKTVGYEGSALDLDRNDSGNWTSGKIGDGELFGTKYGITPIDYKKFFGKQPTRSDMELSQKLGPRRYSKASIGILSMEMTLMFSILLSRYLMSMSILVADLCQLLSVRLWAWP